MNEDPSAVSFPDEPLPDDDLLASARASTTLEMVGFSGEDLVEADDDSDLIQALRIAHEVLTAISDANALGAFVRLPKEEQANFLRWIAATDDQELVRKRTATFVQALHESPLSNRQSEMR